MKRFWDSNYGGQGYDPVARRRGAPTDTPATIAPLSGPRSTSGLSAAGRSGGKTPISGHRAGSTQPNEAIQNLQTQLRDMTTHMEGLEKERDFYFAKVPIPVHRASPVLMFAFFSFAISKFSHNSNRKSWKRQDSKTKRLRKFKKFCIRPRQSLHI